MNIADVIGLGITCSSILVASAAFLLGFYLTEKTKGTPSKRLGTYKFAILSMAIPSILITIPLIPMVFCDGGSYWILVDWFLIISLFPSIVLIGILFKTWD